MKFDKRDPTKAQRRINKYERRLTSLFPPFKARLELLCTEGHTAARGLEAGKFPVTLDQFGNLLNSIIAATLTRPASGIVAKEIPESYQAGAAFANKVISATVPGWNPDSSWRVSYREQVATLITRNNAAFAGVTSEMSKEITRVVADGMVAGTSNIAIAKEILEIADRVGPSRARTIARTETMTAINTGVVDRYKDAGIELVEWISAQDEQSCEECDDLDGEQWPIDEAPRPPLHPNCRCTLRAIVVKDTDISGMLKV